MRISRMVSTTLEIAMCARDMARAARTLAERAPEKLLHTLDRGLHTAD